MPTDRRNYDRESGMNRVSNPKKFDSGKKGRRQQPPPQESPSEEEFSYSEPEVEEFMDQAVKDDSRRKRGPPPPKAKRIPKFRPNPEPVEEEQEEAPATSAPKEKEQTSSQLFLISAAYRTGMTTRGYPTESTYVPDVANLFAAIFAITLTISENSLLHEKFPAYTSLGLYAYYAHAFFYHILRVRDDAQLLTRIERRCLRRYQQAGPPESWEIANPLAGFFQAFGRTVPEGGKYGQIVPAFPNFGGLSGDENNTALAGLGTTTGIGRIPIMPAILTFLRNFGNSTATYDDADGFLYPTASKTLGAANTFLGIARSRATDVDFQTLAFSSGWKAPTEAQVDTYVKVEAQKRTLTRRWNIPEMTDTSDFSTLEGFLGLEDNKSVTWIGQLLKLSAAVNMFFPESTNLSKIPTTTRSESHTLFELNRPSGDRAGAADHWYHGRSNWKVKFEGRILRDDAPIAYQSAMSSGVRVSYHNSIIPALFAVPFRDVTTGPYFDAATHPAVEVDGEAQPDPVEQFPVILETRMYDNKGGKS
jgi:hypothetical protein